MRRRSSDTQIPRHPRTSHETKVLSSHTSYCLFSNLIGASGSPPTSWGVFMYAANRSRSIRSGYGASGRSVKADLSRAIRSRWATRSEGVVMTVSVRGGDVGGHPGPGRPNTLNSRAFGFSVAGHGEMERAIRGLVI